MNGESKCFEEGMLGSSDWQGDDLDCYRKYPAGDTVEKSSIKSIVLKIYAYRRLG